MSERLDIAIAGAGLAGLSAALSLHKAGFAPRLFERRDVLSEAGAGIQISPNAARCLGELGLLDSALERGFEPESLESFDGLTGRPITSYPLRAAMRERFGAPNLVIHRQDLQSVFLEGLEQRGLKITLDAAVNHVQETAGGISFKAGQTEHRAEGLVIADGIWSRLRHLVDPALPTSYGHTACRIVIPRENLPEPFNHPVIGLWLAPRIHVVHYPVKGGDALNIVVVIEGGEVGEGWNKEVEPAMFEEAISSLAPPLRDFLISQAGWRSWSLAYVRVSKLAKGRMVLAGDAGHATLPYMAQGGAMAIGDGLLIAHQLQVAGGDVVKAFHEHDEERLPRASQIQDLAFQNASTFHLSGFLATARNKVMQLAGASLLRRYDWLYSWQPPKL